MSAPEKTVPFKISVLVFVYDARGRHLLIKRTKAPNKDCWSPPGGKLEMALGESPFECARRELLEETGFAVEMADLHLFATISEKNFEGSGHWLMFLFNCQKPIAALPASIDEGRFEFFTREEINNLAIPPTDHTLVWPYFDKYKNGFVALRADCDPAKELRVFVDQAMD